MNRLQYQIGGKFDDEGFAAFILQLAADALSPISIFVCDELAKKVGSTFAYVPVESASTTFGYNSRVKSETLIASNGILVVDLSQASSRPSVGLLSLGSVTQTEIVITAYAATLQDANALLRKVCRIAYRHFELEPPFADMLDEGSAFFIVQQQKSEQKFLAGLGDGVEYAAAKYTDRDLDIAASLADKEIREFVVRFLQASSLSDEKFSSEISALSDGGAIRSFLFDSGFVQKETFVECRKTNQQIARFRAEEVSLDALQIHCGKCNRLYKDERVVSAFVPTDQLREIVRSSRWMNVLVTSYLVENGIQKESIFWNVTFGSDEIDIIAFVDGLAWAFELKDIEFSASDAHHFNYRRSLIKPSEAFVITTEFVSPDAKKVFSDVSASPFDTVLSGSSKLPAPILIEGLEQAAARIKGQISAHERFNLRWRIRSSLSGINAPIAEVVAQKNQLICNYAARTPFSFFRGPCHASPPPRRAFARRPSPQGGG